MIESKRFEVDHNGERFALETHIDNPAHEARIRWEAIDRDLSGKWGRLYLPDDMNQGIDQVIQNPIFVFETGGSVTIDEKNQSSIGLPRPIAAQLQESIDELGTATVDSASVETDPTRFPPIIKYRTKISTTHLDKAWWDSSRFMMWYAPDKPDPQSVPTRLAELISQIDVYGYQIECGSLIHRANETPTNDAADELKKLLKRTIPTTDTQFDSASHLIDKHLE